MCSLILWLYLFGPDVAILCFRVVWSSVAVRTFSELAVGGFESLPLRGFYL